MRLWLESFAVVNRCTGKLLWVIIISIGLFLLAAGVIVLGFGSSAVLSKMQLSSISQAVGIVSVLLYIAFVIVMNIYGFFFTTVCWRIIAGDVTEQKQPLSEVFSSSVIPTIYQVAAYFLLSFIALILTIIIGFLGLWRYPILGIIAASIVFITIGIRLCYGFIAIAIKRRGPIDGFIDSWNLTGQNYVDALCMCLIMIGSVLLVTLFFATIGYGLFITIPLHFANSFNLSHHSLIWILVGAVLAVLAVFFYFVIIAFPVLVFLNRNAVLFDARNAAAPQENIFVPLPELELPDIRPNPEHAQQAESTIRTPVLTDADLRPVQQQPQQPRPAPAPRPEPQSQPTPSLDSLEVSQASINTSEEDTNTLSQHLDKVYTPKAEDIVQYGDEDRMPTILFDDEMAKQLQQNQAQYAPKPKDDNGEDKDNGPESIKMSKF